jgi:hypothetical protein
MAGSGTVDKEGKRLVGPLPPLMGSDLLFIKGQRIRNYTCKFR